MGGGGRTCKTNRKEQGGRGCQKLEILIQRTFWMTPYDNVGQKALNIHISGLCTQVYSISEWTQDTKVFILSLVFTIIFHFLRSLLITLILDEGYMFCSIKIKNKSSHKYIAYSLPSYYLNLREHRQKTFVTLSGFWLLRGWGVRVNPLKKGNLWRNFFLDNFESSSEKL